MIRRFRTGLLARHRSTVLPYGYVRVLTECAGGDADRVRQLEALQATMAKQLREMEAARQDADGYRAVRRRLGEAGGRACRTGADGGNECVQREASQDIPADDVEAFFRGMEQGNSPNPDFSGNRAAWLFRERFEGVTREMSELAALAKSYGAR